jgi:subtilisin family serine protease
MKLIKPFGFVSCVLSLLVACGGGGGDLSTTPTPTPPTISSALKTVMAGEDASLNMTVSGGSLTFRITSEPAHGTASITSAGVLTYTAAANTKVISDKLTVTVSNSAGSASAEMNFIIGTDPLAAYQWHLINTGQDAFSTTLPVGGNDLNVKAVWATGITGKGVIVNVVDSGLEIAHPDLAANVTTGSVNFGGGTDPTKTSTTGDHGTSVAGLIASVAGNGLGGKGVAYGAKLMGHNWLGGTAQAGYTSLENLAKSYGGVSADTSFKADIFTASYGAKNCIFSFDVIENAIYSNVKTLRNGKGGLVVKSAGNGFDYQSDVVCSTNLVEGISNDNSAFDGTNTVDNVIVVASVNASGKKSSYSTTGANIWISGFGGESGWNSSTLGRDLIANGYVNEAQPAMITTDQSGCDKGYHTKKVSVNNSPKSFNEFEKEGSSIQTSLNIDCNYTSRFNGTSSAAPTVAGVIALMLEARPELTWRDVKHILAKTAKKVDPALAAIVTNSTNAPTAKTGITVEQAWVTNNAGFHFHNWYGFGLVDAAAAVAMAKSHTLLSAEKNPQLINSISPTVTLDTTITFQATANTLETAGLAFNFEAATGSADLNCVQFELTSPKGTKSILLNGGSGAFGAYQADVALLSNAFYGESSLGTWSLLLKNICSLASTSFTTTAPTLTIRGR